MQYAQHIKKQFPFFQQHPDFVYLDNAATTHKPGAVVEAVHQALVETYAPIHRGVYQASEQATMQFEQVRKELAHSLGVTAEEIIFTPSATYGLNLVVFGWAANALRQGDVIVLTAAEHHANLVPWQQLASRLQLRLVYLPVIDGQLDVAQFQQILATQPVKVLAFPTFANSTGMPMPVEQLLALARANGVVTVLDASQSVAYDYDTIAGYNADCTVFSGHKFGAPTGVGVLRVLRALYDTMKPYIFGGGMVTNVSFESATFAKPPRCFEPGTPAFESVCGLGAALRYMQSLDMPALIDNRRRMMHLLVEGLTAHTSMIPVAATPALLDHGHICSFTHPTIHAHDIAALLGERGIAVRAGNHCAQPFVEQQGVGATVRVSLFWYSTEEDIVKLVQACSAIEQLLSS